MVLTLRNRLPFTRVHSHAGTQKSSGAFFLDMGTERCMFQAGGLRNALRAFEAVRPTDVMFQFCFLHIIWIGNDKKSALLLSSFFCCWLAMVLGLDLSKISEEYLYLRLHIHTTQ